MFAIFTNSKVQMAACFPIIGDIVSTTREFVNYIKAQVERYFTFKSEKNLKDVLRTSIFKTLILQERRFLLMIFSNHGLNANDKLPRYDKTTSTLFFGQTIDSRVQKFLFKNILKLLSINLMENSFLFKTSFHKICWSFWGVSWMNKKQLIKSNWIV